jgi:selenoprotein W-related protein
MPRAVRLTEKLYEEFAHRIAGIKLITSKGGVFEVVVDGTLLYSKKETKRHTSFEEVRDLINSHLGGTEA